MQKAFIFGLVMIVFLASAVSAQLTTNWVVEINGNNVMSPYSSRPVIFYGPDNTLLFNFTAINTSSNVQIIGEWRPVGGSTLFGFEALPSNIVAGQNYSKLFNIDTFWSQVPEGLYILNLTITNGQVYDSMEFTTLVQAPRIPLYECGVLNQTYGYYVLQNDIVTQGDCFAVNSHYVTLDLHGHKLTGNGTGQAFSSHDFLKTSVKNGEVNNFSEGIYISNGQNNRISNISFNYNKYAAISLYDGENNVVENNLFNNVNTNYLSAGIWSYRSVQSLINNNIFNGNANGIYIIEGEGNQVLDNNIKNSGQNSILIKDSIGTLIKNNLIDNLGLAYPEGIQLFGETSESIITNNTITGEGDIGVLLENGPFNNKISYNTIEKQKKGLWLEEGVNNTINGNTIISNSFTGLTLEEGEGNLIYDNIFNNNVNIIFEDDVFANSWNTSLAPGPNIAGGPFIAGNLWLQPNGLGFSQLCLDANQDRICDVSYNLAENNIYYLPLAYFELGAPTVHFIEPTPAHGSSQTQNSIYVNITSSAKDDHYVFVDFDKSNRLWMRMDDLDAQGNPVDLSTYDNNGIKYGEAHQENGKYGDSFSFDGNGDYIEINGPVSTKTNNVAMSFWVKWDGATDANQIMVYNGNTANSGFGLRLDKAEGYQYELMLGGVGYVETSDTLPQNEWVHLAVARSNGNWTVYENGLPVNIISGSALAPNVPTDRFLIGVNSQGNASFNGYIDEVLVFDKPLSPEEVRSLYNAGLYQYFRKFSNLNEGFHEFKGHAVSESGQRDETEKRIVSTGSGGVIPVYECGTLDQENGNYSLINNISPLSTGNVCIKIVANGITLDLNNMSLDGQNSNANTGIGIDEVDDITIKNGEISRFGSGIAGEGNRISIYNNTISYNEEFGIALENTFDSQIYDNLIEHNEETGMEIRTSNSHIYNNYFDSNEMGLDIRNMGSNLIENNVIKDSYWVGLSLERTSLNVIRNNSVLNSGIDLVVDGSSPNHCNNELTGMTWTEGHPTEFYNSTVHLENVEIHGLILCNADNSTLNNVTLSNQLRMNSLSLIMTDNASFNNVLIENTKGGLWIEDGNYNVFSNIISRYNERYGIILSDGDYNKVVDSKAHNNWAGIYVSGGNNIVENSIFNENSYSGIIISGGELNNTVTGNIIKDNEAMGLLMHYDEEYQPSLIYNNIFNNTLNVEFEEMETPNYWNINLTQGTNIIGGHLIGGNFWAHPSGTGFGEACKNAQDDGICDNPYVIAENNTDYLPLTF